MKCKLYFKVATVLTVYGIETLLCLYISRSLYLVATVLTVYGIETCINNVYLIIFTISCNSTYRLRY